MLSIKRGLAMADGIEAGADVVSGGLFARAVERPAGEAHAQHDHPSACLNCGTALIGSHCHACGQAGHVHRTAGAIFHDIAHGVFHFEGKAWHTLPMLIRRPGELTRRYIDGERARFVSPLALFLFTVFLMFAIVANLPGWDIVGGDFLKSGVSGGLTEARAKVTEERKRAETQVTDLTTDLREERAEAEPDAERIASLERRLKVATEARRDLGEAEKRLPITDALDKREGPATTDEQWLEDKVRTARENPKLLFYKMKTSAYKYSWALIPLSIPFLWLLFPFNRKFGLYDHAVFTTYSLTFMSLLTIVLAILSTIGVPSPALFFAGTLLPPIHIYKQMRGIYSLGRPSALIRTILLTWLIITMIIPAFVLLLLYLGLA
ncbi:DUF3667 domain-containing protein [Sphingomonas radiodurans]|uniref:DUF3667 domain-containing protein n=1 Tax=Sphingomonas radiodurans TaxID=2890321 RepID=UPI001E583E8C|nr:DUF3667 domain-containing protein [Sphingomonas radiodurans]WBH17336.1 DUF3667 domain-containing protein [Sphingomonas radiodurans]